MEEIFFFFFFFYLKVFIFMPFIFSSATTDPYSQALLTFKSQLIDHHNTLSDWKLPSDQNPSIKIQSCSWSGVKCNRNSTAVIALDLSEHNLAGALPGKQIGLLTDLVDLNLSHNSFSGSLPPLIFNLTNLRSLDISRNNFSGEFPAGISGLVNLVVLDAFSNSFSGTLPVEISQLEYLKILNLAGSYFEGPIPPEFGSFKRLEFIHLAGNLLSGHIPPELGKLKTVTHMEIGYNLYEGSIIPWQLGNMSELQYLDIAGASLSGSIPKQLSNLTKLQSLFLFRNQLSGLLPWELGKIETLSSLDLSDNLISGPIPDSFAELKNLKLLSLMYNEMNGSVPQGIAELTSLDTLLIWDNFFSGSLPEGLGRNSNLKWVDVSTNNFVGSIPPDICARGVLFKLILFSNSFNGSLSPSISNCSSLVRLRIEHNNFSGEIPLKFSHLPDITYVDLSRNKFTGGIPTDISLARRLEYFNISKNPGLGGTIPAQTWSMPRLLNFSASECNISGYLPSFRSCKSISVIELDRNSLGGSLPGSISDCKALANLDIASNKFTGVIPKELATLQALGFIDLSHNNFSGSFPVKFAESSSLVLLNVSFNDISGSIPSNKLFESMGSSAFAGNEKLCGRPLQQCHASMAIFGSKGTRKLTWILLLCAGIVMFIVASAWGIVYIRNGSKGRWKMVSFNGLPQFTANDVLRSFSSTEAVPPHLSASIGKAVLPTGITVSVKKIEFEANRMKIVTEFITQMGNARHKNLIRLLGFCHNKQLAYLLYDYLPNGNLAEKINVKRDWAAKYKLVIGIARGLSFLHHECYPAICHGDLKSGNIMFDENMEPHLAEFGIKYLTEMAKSSSPAILSMEKTGESSSNIKEELDMDTYSFGEIILEILSNGRLVNAGGSTQSKPKEALIGEIYAENDAGSYSKSVREEIKIVLEVALLCTTSRAADRPSMEDALKLLSGGFKSQRK